jgi:hypothetical protein
LLRPKISVFPSFMMSVTSSSLPVLYRYLMFLVVVLSYALSSSL